MSFHIDLVSGNLRVVCPVSLFSMTFLGTEEQQKKKKIKKIERTMRNQEMGPSGGEGRKGMHVFSLCLQCLCGTIW